MINETMDNQQVTSLELAYIAGLWDGEGTITIVKSNYRNSYQLTPRISIGNTEIRMIEKVIEIFDKLGIGGHLRIEEKKSPRKDLYRVEISHYRKCKKFIDTFLPYLYTKQPQAKLLLRFIESRLTKYKKLGQTFPYIEKEILLMEQLRNLNKKGKKNKEETSETLR